MSAHTVGRLKADIQAPDGFCAILPDGGTDRVALVASPEDARRLAACWNAFEEMATTSIELMPARGVDALATYAADCHKERDQLRTELTEMRSMRDATQELGEGAYTLLAEVLDAHDCDELEYVERDGTTEPTERFKGIVERIRALLNDGAA